MCSPQKGACPLWSLASVSCGLVDGQHDGCEWRKCSTCSMGDAHDMALCIKRLCPCLALWAVPSGGLHVLYSQHSPPPIHLTFYPYPDYDYAAGLQGNRGQVRDGERVQPVLLQDAAQPQPPVAVQKAALHADGSVGCVSRLLKKFVAAWFDQAPCDHCMPSPLCREMHVGFAFTGQRRSGNAQNIIT